MNLETVGPIVIGKDAAGERLTLVARVYREGLAHSARGTAFVRARLTHAKGCWTGFFPTGLAGGSCSLAEGRAIRLEARRFEHKVADDSLRIERWLPLTAAEEDALRLDLLPSAVCPHPWLVGDMVEMLDRLSIRSLHEFAAAALCDPSVRDRYLTVPASLHAHHNLPGGLIRHSMEVARFVAGFSRLSDTERELGAVAGLVHDIGKLRRYRQSGADSELGEILSHEALTLEMLAGPLKSLEGRWPDGATSLRHLLAADVERKSFYERVEQRVGLVLRFADQWSAHGDKNRRAFQIKGTVQGIAAFGKQRFWRPRPPRKQPTRRPRLSGTSDNNA